MNHFHWKYYLDKYPDLRINGVHTENQALNHWINYGEKEGRVSIQASICFDWKYYLDKYPDLRINGVHTENQALNHWINYGEKEGRLAIKEEIIYMKDSFVFTTLHDSNFQCLANITCANKKQYCDKHNYPLLIKNDNWSNIPIGFEKAYLIQDAFEKYPDCKWVFFSECDTVITNMDIKLEQIIQDETKHVVITSDINGINAGNFFIKNTIQGKFFLQNMIDNISNYNNEQEYIISAYSGSNQHMFKQIMSLYPQRCFNSYDYDLYTNCNSRIDMLGNDGTWQKGDFIIHFPGKSMDLRIKKTLEYV